jgi:hypothetical protein
MTTPQGRGGATADPGATRSGCGCSARDRTVQPAVRWCVGQVIEDEAEPGQIRVVYTVGQLRPDSGSAHPKFKKGVDTVTWSGKNLLRRFTEMKNRTPSGGNHKPELRRLVTTTVCRPSVRERLCATRRSVTLPVPAASLSRSMPGEHPSWYMALTLQGFLKRPLQAGTQGDTSPSPQVVSQAGVRGDLCSAAYATAATAPVVVSDTKWLVAEQRFDLNKVVFSYRAAQHSSTTPPALQTPPHSAGLMLMGGASGRSKASAPLPMAPESGQRNKSTVTPPEPAGSLALEQCLLTHVAIQFSDWRPAFQTCPDHLLPYQGRV